jgi:hypothetical protein
MSRIFKEVNSKAHLQINNKKPLQQHKIYRINSTAKSQNDMPLDANTGRLVTCFLSPIEYNNTSVSYPNHRCSYEADALTTGSC